MRYRGCICLLCALLACAGVPAQAEESQTAAEGERMVFRLLSAGESVDSTDYLPYASVLDACSEKWNDPYLVYYLYDMDGDGVKELIVQEGTCEADMLWNVYTLWGGAPVCLGGVSASHSLLYPCPEGGMYLLRGQMGFETILHVTLSQGRLDAQTVSEREVPPQEDYTQLPDYGVRSALISDHSLLAP
ncbi:MAG: hypothetical protein UFE80_10120 [Christensenellales bacterium]|jgi:hypothetical protein|uniref:Uncharacterized protein n=1 Tax=Candidatus Avichristensenella intestinipullorum TaxID=2840693 RepID=A0A9D0YWC7_9FIRM|nr:hypothetical protein [Christensenellales bacterium]HIQ63287.1 hypothetical protein [Candidatus Avichristensenella intestinipullorum]